MKTHAGSIAAALLALGGCGREPTAPPPLVSQFKLAQTVATEKRTPFESFDFDCGWPSTPPTRTLTGNTLHVRGLINYSYHVSTNELVEGPLTVWVDANINLSNGAGSFQGTLELAPTVLGGSGSWVGNFGGHLNGGKFEGSPLTRVDARMIAHGTGVLEGQAIMFDHLVNTAFEHPEGPAGCTFDGELFKGIILDPRG
jgi:hypothetical protein